MQAVQGFSNFVIFQALENPGLFLCLLILGPEVFLGACLGFGGNPILLVGHGLSSVMENARPRRAAEQSMGHLPRRELSEINFAARIDAQAALELASAMEHRFAGHSATEICVTSTACGCGSAN
jgi:hypothetical protein